MHTCNRCPHYPLLAEMRTINGSRLTSSSGTPMPMSQIRTRSKQLALNGNGSRLHESAPGLLRRGTDDERYPQITVYPAYPVDDVSDAWLFGEPIQVRLNLTAVEADKFATLRTVMRPG